MGEGLAAPGVVSWVLPYSKQDLLESGLIDEFEAPYVSAQPLDVEQVQPREVFDPAKLDIELDFVAAVHADLSAQLRVTCARQLTSAPHR